MLAVQLKANLCFIRISDTSLGANTYLPSLLHIQPCIELELEFDAAARLVWSDHFISVPKSEIDRSDLSLRLEILVN